jgi:hypothetical protein
VRPAWLLLGLALILLGGCQAPPPTEQEMRAALAEALHNQPPEPCRLLGHAGGPQHPGAVSWLVQTEVPLRLGADLDDLTEHQIPASALQAKVQALAGESLEVKRSREAMCDYAQWTRGATSCRLWQMQTDAGWLACLETLADGTSP